jgi:tetratricopeptide (TPR) repeat protein
MATENQIPTADLNTVVTHAAKLLRQDPGLAREQAEEILRVYPDLPPALQILGASYRLQGDPERALLILRPLAGRITDSADLLHELGLALGATGRGDEAIEALRGAVKLNPRHSGAWRSLGDQLSVAGDDAAALEAFEKHLEVSTPHKELIAAAEFFRKGNVARAERLTREVLKKDPTDVVAIRLLANIGVKVGQYQDARNLLERCLELAPDFHMARHSYAITLLRSQKLEAALEQMEILLKAEPMNPNYMILKATILVRKGDHAEAMEMYERLLKDYPNQGRPYTNYGHTLKTVGRLEDAIRAYRKSIELSPGIGESYWSLANLKTFRFSDDDIAQMRGQIVDEGGDPEEQAHLAFALGKAYEDRGDYDQSFHFYQRGNAIRSKQQPYSAKRNVFDTVRQIKTLDAAFFESHKGVGYDAPDPIFIVGLPRAGSTLLEQILASHSRVQGTAELPDIIAISRKLAQKTRKHPAGKYPEILAELPDEQFREMGKGYIESTRVQRGDLPFFIDKMPNNFQHIGLIHLILPNAKIIDARRHPMAGCFSGYKQLFARGQTYTYNLTDIGRYYRDYVTLMDHWDAVLPGRVLRVQYEDMVADTENQIRRLLDYCGLEFEEQCLRFYETKRAIRTPSSEQVRQPVYTEGLEQWRNYEKHLGPLKEALGPVLDRYPI